jgi:hypothetical protein
MLNGADKQLPKEMKAHNHQNYEHCIGNIAGMLREEMHERRIIKI